MRTATCQAASADVSDSIATLGLLGTIALPSSPATQVAP
eukprot:CAMPEP_0177554158 /NCGR_PEP_ID=MMETSP0369-20130122/67820_1 /TAXON_ID=447022 ORGANISM="Scrippsiella hangoei-like, Strain SHHI-4" /NCGR_SAMPLE_ID=MMETSP0369 /ASSEMBLY_ACC=CAM_ASM_000364 /LENGTH=38 /DNA_ID= /DNA_START= /DNA_END= /DNA_ORIENTATION=